MSLIVSVAEVPLPCMKAAEKQKDGPDLTDAHVDLALDGRLVKGRVVPVVARVGVGALAQEQADHLGVAERAGVVQRDEAPVVPRVHVGARLEEVLHNVLPAEP